jgi:hypothetical protein
MSDKIVEGEFDFLITLREIASQYLLEASLNSPSFPKDFDVIKGIEVLNRAIDSEIDFLHQEPDDYLDIYG